MVRALLDGRKTQTRRILKNSTEHRGLYNPAYLQAHRFSKGWEKICPYGKPGDVLWVRETFAGFIQTSYEYDEWREAETDELRDQYPMTIEYRATSKSVPEKWRPSLFMPRWASRLTLEITGVRVERLNDISEYDSVEEGINYHCQTCGYTHRDAKLYLDHDLCGKPMPKAQDEYRGVWQAINGPGSWDENPWVWVLDFKVHKTNAEALLNAIVAL